MRKKLAGIHLLAPLTESDITDLSRNLDRELIINTTPVTDAVIDTHEKTNYIVSFEYDTTLDGGTNRIRRSIPTLELLGNTDANISGTHWINLEDKTYHYIDDGATTQRAFEQLDEQLTKVCYLKHIRDTEGIGSIVSSDDGTVLSSVVDNSIYTVVLGVDHELNASNHGFILGGSSARMLSSLRSTIINGNANYIHDSDSVSIYGGESNIIGADTSHAFIMHGMHNSIDNATESAILGGHHNRISEIENNAYGSFVIGSVYGYIGSSDFSSINNSANSYITGGKYNGINLSSYIEIGNSTDALVSISTNSSIGKSTFTNIIASTYTNKNLTIYNSTAVSIESSTNSYIWHSDNATISASVDSSIGKYFLPNSVDSISKTTIRLGVSDITDFKIGQLVTLTGAEFTSYTEEYRIYDIDVPNKFLYFVDKNSNQVNFNASNTDAITIKILNRFNTSTSIISNTNDTVVCTSTLDTNSAYIYIVIGNLLNRYTAVSVSGSQYTNTIKLKLYGTDTIITNLTPNALAGLTINTYNNNSVIDASFIAGSVNSNAYFGSTISILSSTNGIVHSGTRGALIATNDSSVNNFSNAVIMGGTDHYINGSTGAIIIGGYNNYLSNASSSGIYTSTDSKIYSVGECVIIGSYNSYITAASRSLIIGAKDSHIQSSDDMILGGYNQYIEGSSNSVIIGGGVNYLYSCGASAIIGSYGSTIHNCAGGVILGGYSNTVNGSDTGPYPDVSDGLVAMIACNNITAWRNNAVYMPSIALVESTFELRDKTPEVGNALVVESVTDNVATLKWGEGGGGGPDMTPIPINEHSSALSYYNTNPKKIVYIFNSNTCYDNTGSGYRNFYLTSGGEIYPNGTIIYIILHNLAPYISESDTHGIKIITGGYNFSMSSNKYPDGTNGSSLCRTVAFQKVSNTEWMKFVV